MRLIIASTIAATLLTAGTAPAQDPEVLAAAWLPDRAFPAYDVYWTHAGAGDAAPDTETAANAASVLAIGANVHVHLRNSSDRPLAVSDVLLDGLSLTRSLAFSDQRNKRKPASIYFADLSDEQRGRLIAHGEPVWFKIDPPMVEPGGICHVVIRQRRRPEAGTLPIEIVHNRGSTSIELPARDVSPRFASISFPPGLNRIFAYVRHSCPPVRILLDGRDITARTVIRFDADCPVVPLIVDLDRPLRPASLHCLEAVFDDDTVASASLRAWANDFAYGIFGGMPGRDEDTTVARQYVDDLARHNINLQMPQLGSAAVRNFFASEAGRRYQKARNLRCVIDQPGKWGVRDPYLMYIHDEPDCGDYRMTGLPEDAKIGALAQWCVQRSGELRAAEPDTLQMLNLDMTYKPFNWYTYGQVPDVLSVDPYYQARLRTAFFEHPERIPFYEKATYVHGVATVAQSACEPNPLHVILYACSHIDADNQRQFRFPTPAEKRIEVYYALAAGARSLSYWWYTPARPGKKGKAAYGIGAATRDNDPGAIALWDEIGRIGAEIRQAAFLLARSCPTDLKIKATNGLWVRSLLVADEAVILLVVNDQYTNDEEGTTCEPVSEATLAVDIPAWLDQVKAFEITPAARRGIKMRASGGRAVLDLGSVDVTRMIVLGRSR